MEVRIENDPPMNLQMFMHAAVAERLHKDVASRRRSEDRQPAYGSGGDEVRALLVTHLIAAAHILRMEEAQLQDKHVPKCNLGTCTKVQP
jgi:hypothetical protein